MAEVMLDTDMAEWRNAMNLGELLRAALASCVLNGIKRMTPMLHFRIDAAKVRLEAA
jgi:hypothetical protein